MDVRQGVNSMEWGEGERKGRFLTLWIKKETKLQVLNPLLIL